MATCRFCNQQFDNQQAVRAHLKGCNAYKRRHNPNGASLGSVALGKPCLRDHTPEPEASAGNDLDSVSLLEKRLAAERIRLQLRGVEEAHAELDERAQAKVRERERQSEQQQRAAQLAEKE